MLAASGEERVVMSATAGQARAAPTEVEQTSPVVARIEGGGIDQAWLESQWRQYRRWAAAILLAYKPRWADLDDLLQDVAMAVVRKGHEVRDEAAFKPWLRTVAINCALMAARKGQKWAANTSLDAGDDETGVIARIASGSATPAAEYEQRKEGERLVDLCAQIPDGYREPLMMKAVRGMSYREIGEVMDLPETTVETRIARARKMLRELAGSADGGIFGRGKCDGKGRGEHLH